MATKTISLELDAYETLKRAKRSPRESFSSVVRRAKWDDLGVKGPDILKYLKGLVNTRPECILKSKTLDLLEDQAMNRSKRPQSKWEE